MLGNRMYILGLPYRINVHETKGLEQALKAETEAETDIVKFPKSYKKDTTWRVSKESVLMHLNSKTGQGGIPLIYFTQENDVPQIQATSATLHEQLVNCTILYGRVYNTDNGTVYDLLQSLTLKGPVWTWIKFFQWSRDERNAWKSLINFHQGDSAKTRNKKESYDAISKANYQGF
jgi:hypothetical protein